MNKENRNNNWDLSVMFDSNESFLEELKSFSNDMNGVLEYKGKVFESSKTLLKAITFKTSLDRRLENLYVFINMKSHENMGDSFYQDLKSKVDNKVSEYFAITSFFIPEVLTNDYDTFEKYANEEQDLLKYKKLFKDIFRFKPHVLTSSEEKVLASFGTVLNSSSDISSLLMNVDLKFDDVLDSKGNANKLTNSNYINMMKSNDRVKRQNAFNSIYNGYSSVINTFAKSLHTSVLKDTINTKLRNYESTIKSSLFSDNIDISVYDNLVNMTNERLDVLHKFYEVKKKVLNLDELHLYDVHVDPFSFDKNYSFEEASDIVKDSLGVLGNEYISVLSSALENNWIDKFPKEGKKSGAYSWGSYDSYPYILMNFEGDINDVSTLTHELGHSIHTYYSNKNNEYHYASYKIFVAEVASTVNELLLYDYLYKSSTDNKLKLYALNQQLKLYVTTFFRQTMFAEFEKNIYSEVESGESLTVDKLNENYFSLVKKYFGPSVNIDEKSKFEWARIPHFYNSFYVYQYATGIAAATYIVEELLKDESYKEKYIKFLKGGNSKYPLELLNDIGVDMSDAKVIESALNRFESILLEFEKTLEVMQDE